jgi:TolB-like protein/class 3 adenylate cyclase/tetratricopeptide (TPR) repeat protein
MSKTRQLAAIMFTDIVGYTDLMGKDTDKALELLSIGMEIQKQLVKQHNGKWLKEMGDGALVSFSSALDAVNCSIEIQESVKTKLDARLRIGIHLGDITIEKNDVYGDGVNVASRLESIADPGGIYISDNVEKSIKGRSNVQAKYLGEIKLKNVAYDVRTYALQGAGLPVPGSKKNKEISGRFQAEVERRGVIRVALTYLAFSLFLILLLPYVGTMVTLPLWFSTALRVVLFLGFPIAMYLAWNYERSPKGFVRTSSQQSWQNPNQSSQRKPMTSNFIIMLLVVGSSVLYFYPKYSGTQDNLNTEIFDKSVAVIPFDDISPTADQKYLADGMQEAILNHLAKIKDMRVISRTTMEQYRESNKSAPTIAKDVGVSYILEGSVQRIADKVRITVQLIEGNSDRHLWSENFDRDLIDIFAIQTEIAKNVAEILKTTLSVNEMKIIESIPTADMTAYDFYLKGMDYRNRGNSEEDLQFADQMFKRAIEIDSTFTLAWVGLASVSRDYYWLRYDSSEERLEQVEIYLDKAIALKPDLLEVRLETARYYYQCKANFANALQILEKLRSDYPNNAQMHAWPGYIYRRMGQFERSLEYMNKAISLNPSGWEEWSSAGNTLVILRRYKQAEQYFKTAIELNPSRDRDYFYLARLYLITGEVERARAMLVENHNIDDTRVYLNRSLVELFDYSYAEAIRILESSPTEIFEDQEVFISKSMQIGLIYFMMSNKELVTTHFQQARQLLENRLSESPDDSRLYGSLGIVYAGLGMKEEAINAGNKALSIMNISVDAVRGFYRELEMARILVMVGKSDEAIAKLEFLLQRNGNLSVELLKRDPFWNPLREIDAFKVLISNPKYQSLDDK